MPKRRRIVIKTIKFNIMKIFNQNLAFVASMNDESSNVEAVSHDTTSSVMVAGGCAGTFGTLGSAGGCFGSFGSYACGSVE
jgi:hypothetical protein